MHIVTLSRLLRSLPACSLHATWTSGMYGHVTKSYSWLQKLWIQM